MIQTASEQEVRNQIRAYVREIAPNPERASAENARLIEDLDYHSLALLELAFALEDEFDLPQIDQETAQQITTVKDIEDFVVAQLRQRTPGFFADAVAGSPGSAG